jgi:hypothetical protein
VLPYLDRSQDFAGLALVALLSLLCRARGVLIEERFGALKFCCLDCEQVWDVLTPTALHRPVVA